MTKKIEKDCVVTYDLGCERPNYKPCLNQSEHAAGKKNVTEHAEGKKNVTEHAEGKQNVTEHAEGKQNVTEHAEGKQNVTATAGVPSCSVDGGCGAGECKTDAATRLDYCDCGAVLGFPNGATNGPNCVEDVCGPNNECQQAGQLCHPESNPEPFGPYLKCEVNLYLYKEIIIFPRNVSFREYYVFVSNLVVVSFVVVVSQFRFDSAITVEGFKLRSSNLTHALFIQISRTSSSIIVIVVPFCQKLKKVADFRTWRPFCQKLKKYIKIRMDLKWPEISSKVNFGRQPFCQKFQKNQSCVSKCV